MGLKEPSRDDVDCNGLLFERAANELTPKVPWLLPKDAVELYIPSVNFFVW